MGEKADLSAYLYCNVFIFAGHPAAYSSNRHPSSPGGPSDPPAANWHWTISSPGKSAYSTGGYILEHRAATFLLWKLKSCTLSDQQLFCVHMQALIYPLTVASKSTTTARHNAANKILKNMCEHCNTLVQQAMMVKHLYCTTELKHLYKLRSKKLWICSIELNVNFIV